MIETTLLFCFLNNLILILPSRYCFMVYGRYGDLIKQYKVPLSRMLHDILDDDHHSDTLHWSGITPIFDPITDLDLITEFDFLPNWT